MTEVAQRHPGGRPPRRSPVTPRVPGYCVSRDDVWNGRLYLVAIVGPDKVWSPTVAGALQLYTRSVATELARVVEGSVRDLNGWELAR